MRDIKAKHEAFIEADERVSIAQRALDAALREHWMANEARGRAIEEYHAAAKARSERAAAYPLVPFADVLRERL